MKTGARKPVNGYGLQLNNKKSHQQLGRGNSGEPKMKRKPDILVVLAALLGLGMILSSLGGASAADVQTEAYISESK